MQVRVTPRGRHLEVIAVTGVVTAPKLNRLTDALAAAVERYPARNLLVEVRAQSRDFPLLEVFAVLAHAVRRLATGTRIAYVVTGRPLPSVKRFYEELADRRDLAFRMFAARREALEWLDERQEAAAH